jgi:hypothetical protein
LYAAHIGQRLNALLPGQRGVIKKPGAGVHFGKNRRGGACRHGTLVFPGKGPACRAGTPVFFMTPVGPEMKDFSFFVQAENTGRVFSDAGDDIGISRTKVTVIPPPAILHTPPFPRHKNSPACKNRKIPAAPFYRKAPLYGLLLKTPRYAA